MIRFAADFNKMTGQLARYDKELRASHVAMAHELRSPLTAAIGRLQGMLDGVFDTQPQQLEMVMKQLQHLNRLTDELHLLSWRMPAIWCSMSGHFVWMSSFRSEPHG
jgi:signal transduction histidine kinase